MTEGGVDEAGVFHKIPRIDDSRLAELFARELLSPEWSERLLSWRHTGFNVHSRVRAKTKKEASEVQGMNYLEFIARVTSRASFYDDVMRRYTSGINFLIHHPQMRVLTMTVNPD